MRWLDLAGFAGTATGLIPAHLVGFSRSVSAECEATIRSLLRSVDRSGRPLRPDLREFLAGPALNPKRRSSHQPLRPYSDTEWRRLVARCAQIIATSREQQRAAVEAARRGQHPRVGGWSPDNVRWLLRWHGPMTKQQAARHIGISRSSVSKYGGLTAPASELFPTIAVTMAYRLLLGTTSGIVPDGLDELNLSDVEWAGDTTVLLNYVKDRTGPESLNLPAPAARTLRRWLEHSALLREFAPEPIRAQLWLVYQPMQGGASSIIAAPEFGWEAVKGWVFRNDLLGDDGQPLRIHKGRIRATFHSHRDKRHWTGRTTIDPNHSPQVEGDHYLSRPTPAQRDALEAVVEQAQTDLVRKATTPIVLTDGDVTAAVTALPSHLAGLELTDQVVAELVAGRRDVFTAACVDQLAGLHGPAGRPCPARPWVCLLCPLAVFAPRHAPNLLRLKAFFARQFRQMTLPQFAAVFGPYARRLNDILPRFAPSVLAAASPQVAGRDAEVPLRPEEAST